MNRVQYQQFIVILTVFLLSYGLAVHAAVSPELITQTDAAIDSLRKRNCTVTITKDGSPLPGKEVHLKQIKNDFGFGGTIATIGFKGAHGDSAKYSQVFQKYFDWATPENEMKWTVTDEADDYTDYGPGDYLVDWCNEHGVNVRGHNLFWNEDMRWSPSWTNSLTPDQFRAAMARRIDGAMAHYKGRVKHWDIINELIHYPQATHGTPEVTFFDSATGDPDIFKWILSRARGIDSVAQFSINEYAIAENLDKQPTTMDIFIDKMNRLLTDTSSFEIVGLEGHFGGQVDRDSYLSNINQVTAGIPRPIWLTEVDFSIPVAERADKTEELMRTCFAHPNVGGLIFWTWWAGNMWQDHYTSLMVDSSFADTDMGVRWLALRKQWKTDLIKPTDATGNITYRGFQGEYLAMYTEGDMTYSGRFYLSPGAADTAITLAVIDSALSPRDAVVPQGRVPQSWYTCNGKRIGIAASGVTEPLFVYTYSVDGRLLSKVQFVPENHTITLPRAVAPGCRVVRIGTGSQTLWSGRFMTMR